MISGSVKWRTTSTTAKISQLVPLAFLLLLQKSSALDLASCNDTLGLESGDIDDTALSASSSFDAYSTGPQNARLNIERNGGAWCPKNAISEGVREWIQIDLQKTHVITGIVTQGRYGKGKGQEYVQKFIIEYRRTDTRSDQDWKIYSDKTGKQIFDANTDTVTPVMTKLDKPIFASHVRIIPFSIHPRIVCLRFELHGCRAQSDIVSYRTSLPDLPGASINLTSMSWWTEDDAGILTDGSYGSDVSAADEVPDYDQGWIGWKRRGVKQVQLTFEFASLKKFHKMNVFTANRFDLNIKVFKKAAIWHSLDGVDYGTDPIIFEYVPDNLIQESRNVSIPMKSRIGKYLRIRFFFDDIWILISEINFDTENVSEDELSSLRDDSMTTTTMKEKVEIIKGTTTTTVKIVEKESTTQRNMELVDHYGDSAVILEIVIGVLTAVTLLLLFFFLIVLVYSRRQKLLGSPSSRSLNPFPVHVNVKDFLMSLSPSSQTGFAHQLSASSTSPATGAGGTGASTNITSNPNYEESCFYESFRPPVPNRDDSLGIADDLRAKWHSTGHVASAPNTTFSRTSVNGNFVPHRTNGAEYASVDIQKLNNASTALTTSLVNIPNYRSLQQPQQPPPPMTVLPPAPPLPHGNSGNNNGSLRHHQVYNLGNYFPRVASEPTARKSYNGARQDPSKTLPLAETCWNVTTFVQNLNKMVAVAIEEVPKAQLSPKESLGSGCLGEILICEIDSAYSNVAQTVAVRSAKETFVERDDFLRESRLLATLAHPNLARLVGVSTTDQPYCTIIEYSPMGSLHDQLSSNASLANTDRLIDVTAQIANGMRYLESRAIVHKDLAARNCLITENGGVKISDFAKGVSAYSSHYSNEKGRVGEPIRWQAWETILMGRVTLKSNVWSFAVTSWEVWSLCKERPFEDNSDVEVMHNAERIYFNDSVQLELRRPDLCDSEIWSLLEDCWSRSDQDRPNFTQIAGCLKRKRNSFHRDVKV